MPRLLLLTAAVLCCAAVHAQSAYSDIHVVNVYTDASGTVVFETEGEVASGGAVVAAGGVLVVRAVDAPRVLVIVGADDGVSGTAGANAVVTQPYRPIGMLRLRSLQNPDAVSGPTYHRVSVYACAETTPPRDPAYPDDVECQTWRAVPAASGGELGFELEVNDGLQVYAPPPPPQPPSPPGEDPPVDPID